MQCHNVPNVANNVAQKSNSPAPGLLAAPVGIKVDVSHRLAYSNAIVVLSRVVGMNNIDEHSVSRVQSNFVVRTLEVGSIGIKT